MSERTNFIVDPSRLEMAFLLHKVFKETDDGKELLAKLRDRFFDACTWGPNAPEHTIYFLEGQRQMIKYMVDLAEAYPQMKEESAKARNIADTVVTDLKTGDE